MECVVLLPLTAEEEFSFSERTNESVQKDHVRITLVDNLLLVQRIKMLVWASLWLALRRPPRPPPLSPLPPFPPFQPCCLSKCVHSKVAFDKELKTERKPKVLPYKSYSHCHTFWSEMSRGSLKKSESTFRVEFHINELLKPEVFALLKEYFRKGIHIFCILFVGVHRQRIDVLFQTGFRKAYTQKQMKKLLEFKAPPTWAWKNIVRMNAVEVIWFSKTTCLLDKRFSNKNFVPCLTAKKLLPPVAELHAIRVTHNALGEWCRFSRVSAIVCPKTGIKIAQSLW